MDKIIAERKDLKFSPITDNNGHQSLTIFARDRHSLERQLKNEFKNLR